MPDLANELSAETEACDSTARSHALPPPAFRLPPPHETLNMKRNFQIN